MEETNKLKAIHWRPNSSKADYLPLHGNYILKHFCFLL